MVEGYSEIRRISFIKSAIWFLVPGIWIYIAIYYLVPRVTACGISEYVAVMGSIWSVTIPLIPLSYLLFVREHREKKLPLYCQRFRFKKLSWLDLKYLVIGIGVSLLAEGLLSGTGKYFAQVEYLAPPSHLPIPFHPLKEMTLPMTHFMGIELAGNWKFAMGFIVLHTLAMLGEEIIWRGYILPRQEISLGKKAWLVNGILWAYGMHLFLKWNFIAMLPSMLIVPYAAQKTKNTWVAVGIHMIPNMILWILIVMSI